MGGFRQYSSAMSNHFIKRTTLFKVAKDEDINAVLEAYVILRKNAVKVCIPVPDRRISKGRDQ